MSASCTLAPLKPKPKLLRLSCESDALSDKNDEEEPAGTVAPAGRSVEYLCGLGCMWDYICDLSEYQSTFVYMYIHRYIAVRPYCCNSAQLCIYTSI